MFNIQFNFNPETSEITDLKVIKVDNSKDAIVTVEENKLFLSNEALMLMNASVGDRISVNYYTVDSELTFPVIGKSELFTDNNDGNKLTKSNTVSFRGSQREILLEYGSSFKLVPFKSYFKMESIKSTENDDLLEEEQDLQNLK